MKKLKFLAYVIFAVALCVLWSMIITMSPFPFFVKFIGCLLGGGIIGYVMAKKLYLN